MSDVRETPPSFREYWPNFLGLYVCGYMTSFFVHFLLQNVWIDLVTGGLSMMVMFVVALVIMDRDARRIRKIVAREKRNQPEPDPFDIPAKQMARDKLTTLHRVAKRVKETSSESGFPTSSPLPVEDREAFLADHKLVVVHFWAPWNGVDRPMDQTLQVVRERWEPGICFRSCDTDDPDNADFCRKVGLATVPSLAIFVDGQLHDLMAGLRSYVMIDAILEGLSHKTGPPEN